MAAAAKTGKAHGMLSVIGLDDKTLEDVCTKARAAAGAGTVCQVANYLFPTGRVVSGHKSALDEARLPDAWHTCWTDTFLDAPLPARPMPAPSQVPAGTCTAYHVAV